jgi:hypothetical protein
MSKIFQDIDGKCGITVTDELFLADPEFVTKSCEMQIRRQLKDEEVKIISVNK